MPITMYSASVPVFTRILKNLAAILEKAQAHAEAKKIEPEVLLNARLFPDMFPLVKQIQVATDFAKGAGARLAGVEPPSYADTEKTFGELITRVQKTVEFLNTLKPNQIEGSEGRDVVLKMRSGELNFKGEPYLNFFALPNFYFHVTTAYAILRHNGVELGKMDFIGGV
ncbi:MAG TPA: DUF1993 domain-containing protein [Pseudomonadales bacterium]|nr:DUF1993 domain-containing protein [Pseudomonadales bacterium]